MTNTSFKSVFEGAIEFAIKDRLNKVAAQEIEAAKKRVEEAVLSEIDKIALRLARDYSVADMGNHLSIHVKKSL